MENKYALLNYDQDSDKPDMSLVNKCTIEIDNLIWEFRDKYLELNKKYKDAGLGDTATDECVAEEFYDILHFGSTRQRNG